MDIVCEMVSKSSIYNIILVIICGLISEHRHFSFVKLLSLLVKLYLIQILLGL